MYVMNRKIKLRAWQKYHKKMLEVLDIGFKDGEVNSVKVKYPEDTIPAVVTYKKNDKKFWLDDCIKLMQYTGLKDNNNNEIYEGDVLKQVKKSSREGYERSSYDKNNFEVVFKYGSFWLQRPYDDSVYIRDFPNIDEFVGFECFKIVGNIYENPELLETK